MEDTTFYKGVTGVMLLLSLYVHDNLYRLLGIRRISYKANIKGCGALSQCLVLHIVTNDFTGSIGKVRSQWHFRNLRGSLYATTCNILQRAFAELFHASLQNPRKKNLAGDKPLRRSIVAGIVIIHKYTVYRIRCMFSAH